MRAFIALPIQEPSLSALIRLQAGLTHGRPVPEENLHLTLAFLGDVSDLVLDEVHFELSRLRAPAPLLRFTGLTVYPATRQSLIVIEVARDPDLTNLAKQVCTIARSAGLDLPRRRFRPHVTLTRGRSAPSALPGVHTPVPQFEATEFCLYRSTLSPDGARHDVLESYPLV
ncbi:MAG: RNA 2',3'-cyclic phosphodiesterase [Dinoroseobacter sp.]|nr:RNA 2',3'-cyclic phosphodiesterase [Dinoroseobacter sp.]